MVGIHQRKVKCTTVCLPIEFIKVSNTDGKTENVYRQGIVRDSELPSTPQMRYPLGDD